jgi:hypothetical protein
MTALRFNFLITQLLHMDFLYNKKKALDSSLPVNVRKAFIMLCIQSSWCNICFETALYYFNDKYNLLSEELTNSQIRQIVDELSFKREKSKVLDYQYKLYVDWKNKKGLTLSSINGVPIKDIFDRRIEHIWDGVLAS